MTIQNTEINGLRKVTSKKPAAEADGRVIVRPELHPVVEKAVKLDDPDLEIAVKKADFADLINALNGARADVKEALLRYLPEQLRKIAEICITRMEKNYIPRHVVEKSRYRINLIISEIVRDKKGFKYLVFQ